MLNNPVVISENLLAQRINVINNNIKEQLNELSQFGIIKYMPKRNSYQVQFILPRPDINKLTFAKQNLKNQRPFFSIKYQQHNVLTLYFHLSEEPSNQF